MLPEVVAYLETHWDELNTCGEKPHSFSYLMQNRNRPSCFIFANGDSEPCFIAKFARTDVNRVCLRREHEILSLLYTLEPPEIRATLPRHLALLTLDQDLAVIETVLPGTPMSPVNIFTGRRKVIEQQFALVYEWLLAFQGHTRQDVLLEGTEFQRFVINPLSGRLSNLDLPIAIRTSIENVLVLAEELEGCLFPITFSHGDMNPTNFLLDKGQITGVVDWEWAGRESLPTMDWFNFMHLFGWLTLLHKRTYPSFGASRLDAIQTTFFTDNPFSRLAGEWTARFFAHYELDEKLIILLLLHALFKLYPEDAMLEEIVLGIAKVTDNSFIPFLEVW